MHMSYSIRCITLAAGLAFWLAPGLATADADRVPRPVCEQGCNETARAMMEQKKTVKSSSTTEHGSQSSSSTTPAYTPAQVNDFQKWMLQ